VRDHAGIPGSCGAGKAVGAHLGYGDWHTVTQEQITLFADATGDHQWIHVDPERAAAGPFGSTVAHGFLTMSLLVAQVYRVEGLSMGVNYGLNRVRFPTPVPAGSRLRAGVELISLLPGTNGAQATARVTVEIDGSARPACAAEWLTLLVP
jgi:acyl dehydratase